MNWRTEKNNDDSRYEDVDDREVKLFDDRFFCMSRLSTKILHRLKNNSNFRSEVKLLKFKDIER